ncbi:MAG: hypothetical protein K8S15_04440 [Candidatus Aegiribacteria sp.]|nr:hypothetical protein [Candidatus Aegiribacteria sp.]
MKKIYLKTFLITLAAFGATYMLLVFSSRISSEFYSVVGVLFAIMAPAALVLSGRRKFNTFTRNMFGIISGLFLWGFIGEFLEVRSHLVIADSSYLPILLVLVSMLVVILLQNGIRKSYGFAFGHFAGIWGLHMWMIYQYEHLSRTHWSTYASAGAALTLGILAVLLSGKTHRTSRKMALSVASLLLFWTVLEYVWGWRLIPGPYSI